MELLFMAPKNSIGFQLVGACRYFLFEMSEGSGPSVQFSFTANWVGIYVTDSDFKCFKNDHLLSYAPT